MQKGNSVAVVVVAVLSGAVDAALGVVSDVAAVEGFVAVPC